MAQTDNFYADDATVALMEKGLKIRDRYGNTRIDRKDIMWRKRNYREEIIETPITLVSLLWQRLATSVQLDWANAASYCGMTGYNLYVQDRGFRIYKGLDGDATPNIHHQFKVMEFDTGLECPEFYFWQNHYPPYYLKQKIEGKKNSYRWVLVNEAITKPIKIEFDYKSQLQELEYLDFWTVDVWFHGVKSGTAKWVYYSFNLDLVCDWQRFSETFNPDLDTIDKYDVDFSAYPVNGYVMFDNFNFEHDGQNWAFDWKCDNINEESVNYGSGADFPWFLDWSGTYANFDSAYIS